MAKKLDKDRVAAKVREMIAQQTGVSEARVTDGANLHGDLGFDSLDSIELVMSIEEEFQIEITGNETDIHVTQQNVGKVVKLVQTKVCDG